jgi:hypothetical protein
VQGGYSKPMSTKKANCQILRSWGWGLTIHSGELFEFAGERDIYFWLINDGHFWNCGVISYAMISRCFPSPTIFSHCGACSVRLKNYLFLYGRAVLTQESKPRSKRQKSARTFSRLKGTQTIWHKQNDMK